MSSSKCWFPNILVGPGTIIPLEKPRAEWKVTQRLTEHESQMEAGAVQDGSRPSFAAVKFRCHDINDPSKEAFMRVYLQIPYAGTESEPAAERARQARMRYLPDELNALRSMTSQGSTITPRLLGYMEDKQDESGWVPGGFIVYLAWKIVPGVRLGDHFEAVEFWKLSPNDRDTVRLAFSRGFDNMMRMGFYPLFAGPKNLVWDSEKKTLYWIGFRECKKVNPGSRWSIKLLPSYDLVKAPEGHEWWDLEWNGDTSSWTF